MSATYDAATQSIRTELVNPATGVPFGQAAPMVVQQRDLITITGTAASGSGFTVTLPAGGAGVFTYLAYLQIILYAAATIAGAATPLLVTTGGLPNNPVFTFPTALAIGQFAEQKYEGLGVLKGSAAAQAITIVTPAQAGAIWRVNAAYFQA